MSNFHAFEAAPGQLAAHRWVGLAAAFAGFGWYLWCICSGGDKKKVSFHCVFQKHCVHHH